MHDLQVVHCLIDVKKIVFVKFRSVATSIELKYVWRQEEWWSYLT